MDATESPEVIADRKRRMKWWHDARFGMFVHWGLYSQLGRHEWVMNKERIPLCEYEPLADSWKPKRGAARQWARLAKQAGMKYMVMTTKHHEGFSLWDSRLNPYNAVGRGPGRDLVAEYVDACHEFGLKVGLYYSLLDWHHPDGLRCAHDEPARRRFVDYTHGLVRELMTNYGKIDILWYDVSKPLPSAQAWESPAMNAMVRSLQPRILINNRSKMPEDFGTPEERITPDSEGRAWEACMTFNGSWGWFPTPQEDWLSARHVLEMLRQVVSSGGNLLLNIGPKADGSAPYEATERLRAVGKWLARNGEAVYGPKDIARSLDKTNLGSWTLKGKTAYFWCRRWPGSTLTIGGLKTRLKRASLLATGKPVAFTQQPHRLMLTGLPETNPDKTTNMTVLKLDFAQPPVMEWGAIVMDGARADA